jgi:hypothetical protein
VWIGAFVAFTCVATLLLGIGQSYLLVGLLAGNVALVVQRWLYARQVRQRVAWTA